MFALSCRGLLGWVLAVSIASAAEPKKDGPTNRLAKESSPYLLQHAHNPVDWYPWGPEAFEKAKKEKKLIFLSVGYSSCHWCHVMERESFQDKEVAEFLNKHFVCVKVDREERPDLDEIYITSLSVMGASTGWPMSVFLTDDAKPIVGGTYWPKEDKQVDGETVRGFKTILKIILDLSTTKNAELRKQADAIAEATDEALSRASRANPLVELNRSLAMGPAEELRQRLDPEHGGMGNPDKRFRGTKFPMPPSLNSLMRAAKRDGDKELSALVALTLDKMATGGIYDQIGGGFHRYSTERTWTVPHFEKMLYDNAQLVELYSEAYRLNPKPLYKQVVDETIAFLKREMTSPDGGFYAALDADTDGKEGEFYVWTAEEIEKVFTDKTDAALFRAVFGISGSPTFEANAYVLKTPRPLAEVAKDQKLSVADLEKKLPALKAKLLDARNKRSRPFLDTKILTAWNGQMIAGLAVASQTFKNPEYATLAAKAADFLLANARTKDGRLLRTYSKNAAGKGEAKLNAYLDDYAHLVAGLLTLHDATGEAKWLNEAKTLTTIVTKWHGEEGKGGFFYTSSDHEKLFARPKDYHDGVMPSSNAVMARNFVRLADKTKDATYSALAEKTLKQFAGVLKGMSATTPSLGEALHLYLDTKPKEPAKPAEEKKGDVAQPRQSSDVVAAVATLSDVDKNGKQTLTLELMITKPWHIYANPVENDDLEGAATRVEIFADGKKLPANVIYPTGKEEKTEKGTTYHVYEGKITLKATFAATKEPLEARLRLQACTGGANGRCLALNTLKVTVK